MAALTSRFFEINLELKALLPDTFFKLLAHRNTLAALIHEPFLTMELIPSRVLILGNQSNRVGSSAVSPVCENSAVRTPRQFHSIKSKMILTWSLFLFHLKLATIYPLKSKCLFEFCGDFVGPNNNKIVRSSRTFLIMILLCYIIWPPVTSGIFHVDFSSCLDFMMMLLLF